MSVETSADGTADRLATSMEFMKELYAYFEENWLRLPYPVIDHALRIEKLPDGTFHFYIHPADVSGITIDFIVSKDGLRLR